MRKMQAATAEDLAKNFHEARRKRAEDNPDISESSPILLPWAEFPDHLKTILINTFTDASTE